MRQSFSVDPELMERIDRHSKSRGIKREEAILELVEAGIGFTEGGGEIKIENKRSYEEFYKLHKDLENIQRIMLEMKNEMHKLKVTTESNNRDIEDILSRGKSEKEKKGFFNFFS